MRHRAFCHEELQPERRFAGGEEPELLARGIPEARCHHLASCGGKQHARGHGAHGEADYAFPLPSEQVKMVKDKGALRVDVTPSIMLRFVEMNLTKPVFKDVRVRQALNYAVNKEALVKVAFAGYADVAEGIAPLSVDYAVKLGPWPYDPQKAKALLKEAGYPNGFEVELWSGYNHTTASKIIQFLQQQLAQVGVKVRVRTLEAGERTSFVESTPQPEQSRHELYYIGWSRLHGRISTTRCAQSSQRQASRPAAPTSPTIPIPRLIRRFSMRSAPPTARRSQRSMRRCRKRFGKMRRGSSS